MTPPLQFIESKRRDLSTLDLWRKTPCDARYFQPGAASLQ